MSIELIFLIEEAFEGGYTARAFLCATSVPTVTS